MIRLKDLVKIVGVSRQSLYSKTNKAILEMQRKLSGEIMFTNDSVRELLKHRGIDFDISELMIPDDAVDVQEIADALSKDTGVVIRSIDTGELKAEEHDGLRYITRSEYEKYLDKHADLDFDSNNYMREEELCVYLGISYSMVRLMRKDNKLEARMHRGIRYYKRDDVEALKGSVKSSGRVSGLTDEESYETYNSVEVAYLLDKSVNTVLNWASEGILPVAKSEGVVGRGKRFYRKDIDEIVKMFAETLDIKQASEYMGVSKRCIYKYLRNNTLTVHDSRYGARILVSDVENLMKSNSQSEAFKTASCI